MNTVTRAQLAETIYAQVGLSRNDSADLLETVLARGNGAARQRRVHEATGDLAEVVRTAVARTLSIG